MSVVLDQWGASKHIAAARFCIVAEQRPGPGRVIVRAMKSRSQERQQTTNRTRHQNKDYIGYLGELLSWHSWYLPYIQPLNYSNTCTQPPFWQKTINVPKLNINVLQLELSLKFGYWIWIYWDSFVNRTFDYFQLIKFWISLFA